MTAVHAKTWTVVPDWSASNPLLNILVFAEAAGEFAAARVGGAELGDTIVIRSFGERGIGNLRTWTIPLTRTMRPARAAQELGQLIAGIPASGVEPQMSTNIVAFFEFTPGFDCANGGDILLITDGIESSDYADEKAFAAGTAALPDPGPGLLSGCTVFFYGLGIGRSPQEVKAIAATWRAWFEKAGATFDFFAP